jgi:hypothetical protein
MIRIMDQSTNLASSDEIIKETTGGGQRACGVTAFRACGNVVGGFRKSSTGIESIHRRLLLLDSYNAIVQCGNAGWVFSRHPIQK